jgi:hypothetical protein
MEKVRKKKKKEKTKTTKKKKKKQQQLVSVSHVPSGQPSRDKV